MDPTIFKILYILIFIFLINLIKIYLIENNIFRILKAIYYQLLEKIISMIILIFYFY
jgi:hypothetical protein